MNPRGNSMRGRKRALYKNRKIKSQTNLLNSFWTGGKVQNTPERNTASSWNELKCFKSDARCLEKYHHNKHQGMDPLIHSISKVTTALSNVSSVFQLFYFLMVCSSMISKGFGFVAFFASAETSSVRIHLSCLVKNIK